MASREPNSAKGTRGIDTMRGEVMKAYPYIRAWGIALKSMNPYIEWQIKLAAKDDAPERAVFRDMEDKWITIDDCVPGTQERIEEIVKGFDS